MRSFRHEIITYIVLYFRLSYFHVSNSALFFDIVFSTLILDRRSLDTFYWEELYGQALAG